MRIRQADKPAKASKKPASADLEAGGVPAPASPNRVGTSFSVGVPSPVQVRPRLDVLEPADQPMPAVPAMRSTSHRRRRRARCKRRSRDRGGTRLSGRTISTRLVCSLPGWFRDPAIFVARGGCSASRARRHLPTSPPLPPITTFRYSPPLLATTHHHHPIPRLPDHHHRPCTGLSCTQASKDDGEDEPFWNVILGLLLVRHHFPPPPPLNHYHHPTKNTPITPPSHSLTSPLPPIDPRSLSVSCSTTSLPGIGSIGSRWACMMPPRVFATYSLHSNSAAAAFAVHHHHRRCRRRRRRRPCPALTSTASLHHP